MEPGVTTFINVAGEGAEVLKEIRMQRNNTLETWQREKSSYLKAALTVEQNLQASGQKPVLNLTLV